MKIDTPSATIKIGDASELTHKLDNDIVDITITSPPYWGQRQSSGFGEEEDPRRYIDNLLSVFVPLLQKTSEKGLLWINIADSYNSSFPNGSAAGRELMNYLQLNHEVMREAVTTGDKEVIDMAKACLSSTVAKKTFGEVFTPIALVDEMLDKLPAEVWSNPSLKWLDPAMGSGNFLIRVFARLMAGLATAIPDEAERKRHILEKMIHGVELQPKNVMIALMFLDPDNEYKTHLVCANSLEFDFWGMKFDVVVGNPPYQDSEKAKGKLGSKALWVRFVNLTIDNLLKENGYVCFVHPSKWRKYQDELWKKMTSRKIIHIDIHGYKDGQRVFGAATRYDWYILKNCPADGTTSIRDEEGIMNIIDIKEWEFIPNFAFDDIRNLLAGDQVSVEILHSYSVYEIRKPHMSKDENDDYKHPCVYSVNRNNEPTMYFSNVRLDFFGIPKVIFASGATGFIVDADGEYGLTQFATGVVDTLENLGHIAKALNSEAFKRIVEATSMSKAEIDRKILGLFRRDFWMDFV